MSPEGKQTRRRRELSLIEAHNALSLDTLRNEFFYPATSTTDGESLRLFTVSVKEGENGGGHESMCNVTLDTSSTISTEDFNKCYESVREMREMYKRSSMGWSATEKKREMKHPAMRFLLVKEERINGSFNSNTDGGETRSKDDEWEDDESAISKDDDGVLVGFLSFMVTEEEGQDVIYCYEVHVKESHRGKGIGNRLISIMERIGKRVGLLKAMLTVFTENLSAINLYENIGYIVDEISPKPKRLRNGLAKADYQIMSKLLSKDTRDAL
ncbi:N alpha-acetyl-transferase [Rhizina undulata]